MRAIAALAAVGVASASQARNLADSRQIQLIRDVTTQCRWASAKGSSFDLSAMTLAPGNYYNVNDMRDPNTRYLFNVCADIAPPNLANNACTQTSNAGSTAFQIENSQSITPTCYRVGGPAAVGWNFTLLDDSRPARGVVATFLGGDSQWCPVGRNRTFSLELLCAPAAPQTRYDDASVIETNTCDYRMQLKSIAGCPLECVTGGSICSNNGVCGYDTDAGKSRCFCYNGFEGGNCGGAAPDQSGMSTEGIILIIVCCVLAGVIGLVAFMFIKLRKLQVDPAAYNELQGRFNELGMLA